MALIGTRIKCARCPNTLGQFVNRSIVLLENRERSALVLPLVLTCKQCGYEWVSLRLLERVAAILGDELPADLIAVAEPVAVPAA